MGSLRMDLRYAFRLLQKDPAFTATVVLILALGIGANAAIYSVVDAVVTQALPGREPQQLVNMYASEEKNGNGTAMFSYPELRGYRDNLTSFSGISAYHIVGLQVTQGNENTQEVSGELVSGTFFDVLGLEAKYGRLLSAADDGVRGANPVAVLSERYWKQHFDGRPDTIGSLLRINNHDFTVIGVAPSAVQQIEPAAQIWLPLSMAIEAEPRMATQIDSFGNDFFHVVARLKPGITIQTAQAELDLVSARLGSGQTIRLWQSMQGQVVSPSNKPPTANEPWEMYDWKKPWGRLAPAKTGFTKEESELSWLLLAVAAMVLLVATADVAGLLLARAEHEAREIAIRASLGASRWALLRQRLVQGLVLASLGGAAGLVAASWSGKLLFAAAPEGFPLPIGFASSVLNVRVVAFVVAASALTAIGFSVLSSFRTQHQDVGEALKQQSVGLYSSGSRGSRLQSLLVIGQIAGSIVLLVGAALLLQTMRNVARIDLGFDTEHVLSASLDLAKNGYTKEQGAAMLLPIIEKARAIPGAQSVALVNGNTVRWRPKSVKTQPSVCNNLPMVMVSPGYFNTLKIPFLVGRDFNAHDTRDAAGVFIVNQAAANLCWPGESPIGKGFKSVLTVPRPFEIVGVVGNVRVDEADLPARPQMYTPIAQFYDALPWQFAFNVLVRTSLPPHAIVPGLTSQIRSLDPKLVLYNIQTPREWLAKAYLRGQFFTRILSVFGVLALVLAATGLYGLLAYVTTRRTKEFGVRMALGALPRQILQLVLSQGGRLIGIGVIVGLMTAAAATRLMQSLLFGVSATDPWICLLACVPFVAAGLIACLLPARRAAAVDPMIALRDE